MSRKRKSGGNRTAVVIIQFVVTALLIAADQWIKNYAASNFKGKPSRVLLDKIVALTYTENTGAAFSLLAENRTILLVVTAVMLIIVMCTLITGFAKGFFLSAGVVMILAGGVSNMIDRVFAGYVIDYIEVLFVRFAIFNFADMLVVVGVFIVTICLVAAMIKESRRGRNRSN